MFAVLGTKFHILCLHNDENLDSFRFLQSALSGADIAQLNVYKVSVRRGYLLSGLTEIYHFQHAPVLSLFPTDRPGSFTPSYALQNNYCTS